MSLKKNIFKNGLASILQKIVIVLQQLMLVPFFIKAWGAEYYGEWITLTIIPSVLALSDFGFGSAAGNMFVLRYASGNIQSAKNIAKTGLIIISGVIIFGLALSLIFLFFLDKYEVFNKSIIEKNDAMFAVFFMMIARILNFYYQFYGAFFRASRRASLGMNLVTFFTFTTLITSFIVLIYGGDVVDFALSQFFLSVVFNPLYAWKAHRTINFKYTSRAQLKRSDVKIIIAKGFGYLMSPTWQAIYFQGTTFVVRVTLGATGVAVFNTIRTVTRSVNQVFTIVNSSVFPEIQYEKGKGNLNNVRKIFISSIASVSIIAFFGVIFLYLFGEDLYEIWTNKLLNPPKMMWNIFLVGILFNALWFTSGVVFNAFNKPYKYAFTGLICSIFSVLASYFLCQKFGLVGAAIGSILLDILMVIFVLPISCSLIGQPLSTLFKDVMFSYKYIYYKLSNK